MESTNNRCNQVVEKFCEVEDRSLEIIQSQENKQKNKKECKLVKKTSVKFEIWKKKREKERPEKMFKENG